MLHSGIGLLGDKRYLVFFDNDAARIVHNLDDNEIIYLDYSDIGMFFRDFFTRYKLDDKASLVKDVVPARYDIVCVDDMCELNQPASEEYEPSIPIVPGHTTVAVYTPEAEALTLALSAKLSQVFIMMMSSGAQGELTSILLIAKDHEGVSVASVVGLEDYDVGSIYLGERGATMVTKPGELIELLASNMGNVECTSVFLGAMIIDSKALARADRDFIERLVSRGSDEDSNTPAIMYI